MYLSPIVSATLLCAFAAAPVLAQEPPPIAPFSSNKPGAAMPKGWDTVKITDNKKPTEYKLVDEGGVTVLEANSSAAATGLAQRIPIDVAQFPIVEWRWKINRLIDSADNKQASKEDAPVRLVFEFDGDKRKLSFSERAQFSLAEGISGRESPYATLMYIWSKDLPVGTVFANPRTNRVQMVVASSGAGGVGAWQSLSRNLREDYRKAYGEEPGRLMAYGVLSDTDNTGESVRAWYGDILFKARPR
jgi:hypothetical protein